MGKVISLALTAGLGLCPGAPAQASDTGRYACAFPVECSGATRPCADGQGLTAELRRDATGWVLQLDEKTAAHFRPVTPAQPGSDALFTLISTDSDPAAGAVTLLSLAGNGQAFMSTHGVFLSPAVVTHIGTCRAEET